ncbi:MAG: stage III sporulation AC/AD family protein [Oscillospiraceae bacterium]|nr:stage III sporulation AC/AD family protein [Oscillospiraceae bacterium]
MDFNVNLIIKITGIGLIVAIASDILKRAEKEEYSLLITIAGLIVIVSAIVPEVIDILDLIRHAFGV